MALCWQDRQLQAAPEDFGRRCLGHYGDSEASAVFAHSSISAYHFAQSQEQARFLTAESRAALLGGLSGFWAAQKPPTLVPNPKQLPQGTEGHLHLAAKGPTGAAPTQTTSVAHDAESTVVSVLTSGSTGQPKTLHKKAGQLWDEATALVNFLEMTQDDTVLCTTASHHVYGLLFSVLAPWLAGAQWVADQRNEPAAFHPHRIAELIAETGTTLLVTVPAHLAALVDADLDLGPLHTVICSAAPLAPPLARAFELKYKIRLLDVLGSTETGGIATRRAAQVSAWTTFPSVQVEIGPGGLLHLTSPWADPGSGATQERASVLPDGSFTYLGRSDSIVKVGGKRISLDEISRAAEQHPAVDEAVALAVQVSSLRGTEIRLVYASAALEPAGLKGHLRSLLDAVFVPRKLRKLSSLPRDERGKLKRSELVKLFEQRSTPKP